MVKLPKRKDYDNEHTVNYELLMVNSHTQYQGQLT